MSATSAEPTTIYRDALSALRHESTDAILGLCDGWRFIAADPSEEWPGDVGRHLARERLHAGQTELERRERVARLMTGCASPADRRYAEWRELARLVRSQADLLQVFDLCDYAITDHTRTEAHAACLVCGGIDRLVITAGPPDLCWCRQCKWGGDVITATMSLRQIGFRDAVSWLADLVGAKAA